MNIIQKNSSNIIWGDETDSGQLGHFYPFLFPFTIGDHTFFYGQNIERSRYGRFIRELHPGGIVSWTTDETDINYGPSLSIRPVLYTVGKRVFIRAQMIDHHKLWYIQEVLPGGTFGSIINQGYYNIEYSAQFPYLIDGKTFIFNQTFDEKKGNFYIVQEMMPDGNHGEITDEGTWNSFYPFQFAYTVGKRTFYYGQTRDNNYWFIQELLPDGRIGSTTESGNWHSFYEVLFPFIFKGRTFYYGQTRDNNYWFIQELLADGKLASSYQSGYFEHFYEVQFPFTFGEHTYFFRHSNDKRWFIQELLL
ncbi:hypothetical protein HZS38_06550 [Xenorhabdus nematophila]|nr:hypothetical protein [Xenorhabdus nematophila]MBA0018835.1 hypothetical protein [Xenorhabdus nematophila]CEF30902.1 conserved hypothetical protein [Xenorhabdus nematophila str. Websteri]CEK25595.1 conserved protein of unknown function [Xenorhabdus nematophila AN6/1]